MIFDDVILYGQTRLNSSTEFLSNLSNQYTPLRELSNLYMNKVSNYNLPRQIDEISLAQIYFLSFQSLFLLFIVIWTRVVNKKNEKKAKDRILFDIWLRECRERSRDVSCDQVLHRSHKMITRSMKATR